MKKFFNSFPTFLVLYLLLMFIVIRVAKVASKSDKPKMEAVPKEYRY